jgi:hypothetical protein
MLNPALPRLPRAKLLGAAIAVALLTGCAANSAATPETGLGAPNAASGVGLNSIVPDAGAPPKCKGQKDAKDYAEVASQTMKEAGGSLCVPAFGGWGGMMQYPGTDSSTKLSVSLTSSTTAYSGGNFPSVKGAIFYLQWAFSYPPYFDPTLPKGSPLVSSHLKPKQPYTIGLWVYYYALGWSSEVSCYQVAQSSKYGGSLAEVGAVFETLELAEKTGAIEVFKGKLTSTQCSLGQ